MKKIVVVGAGGFGREVCDVIDDINNIVPTFDLMGVLDDNPSNLDILRLEERGLRHLGNISEFLNRNYFNSIQYVIGIGSPSVKQKIAKLFDDKGLKAANILHPDSTLSRLNKLGQGVVLCAGARVTSNVTLGDHVHVNPNATVGHDSVIESFVTISPLAAISGNVHLEESVFIGASAFVIQGVSVGKSAVVGASSCVIKNVEPNLTVKGVPAN